jgi:hypothetical protein
MIPLFLSCCAVINIPLSAGRFTSWQFMCWPRGRGTPSDSRPPNDRSGPRVEQVALRGCC